MAYKKNLCGTQDVNEQLGDEINHMKQNLYNNGLLHSQNIEGGFGSNGSNGIHGSNGEGWESNYDEEKLICEKLNYMENVYSHFGINKSLCMQLDNRPLLRKNPCPYCFTTSYSKYGKTSAGTQRRKCDGCRRVLSLYNYSNPVKKKGVRYGEMMRGFVYVGYIENNQNLVNLSRTLGISRSTLHVRKKELIKEINGHC